MEDRFNQQPTGQSPPGGRWPSAFGALAQNSFPFAHDLGNGLGHTSQGAETETHRVSPPLWERESKTV